MTFLYTVKIKLIFFLIIIFFPLILFSQGTWTQKSNCPGVSRIMAVSFSIGSKGYMGTGDDGSQNIFYNDFWEWDQTTNTWTQKATFAGVPREEAIGFSIDRKSVV